MAVPAFPLTSAARGPASGRSALTRAARRRAPVWLAATAAATAVAVNLPLAYLAIRVLGAGWETLVRELASRTTLALALRSLGLAAGVAVLSAAVALPLAWLVTRTDLPGRGAWAVLGALPLVFPSYVAALTLVAFLGPSGFLQGWLAPLGAGRLPPLAYGYTGALLALALFTYPYTYLLLVAALRGLDPALEESSRSLGEGPWRTFFQVVLPQLRPTVAAGTLLVVLYTLSDFGAVSIVRYDTFTLSIYNAYRGLFDRTAAAVLALVLVALTLALVALEARAVRGSRPVRGLPSRSPAPVALGRWKLPALAGVALLSLACVGIPVGVVVFWGARALAVGNPLGPLGAAWEAGVGSLTVSAAAAVAAVALALPVAFWAVRYPGRLARGAERLTHSGYALPGLVIALAMVFFLTRFARPLYQTAAALVAAYVIRFLPEAVAATRSSLVAIAPVLEEAGRSLGRGPLAVFRSVTLPLLRPGLLAGGGLVFLTAMKELPATLILRPIGFETLATRVWSAASEGVYSEAALPALALLAVSGLPIYWLTIRPTLGRAGSR
jgi:iron(III) transport system permease protein